MPASGGKVTSLSDLEKPGVTVAMGSATVPVGVYTRKVLAGLPSAELVTYAQDAHLSTLSPVPRGNDHGHR